MHMNWDDIRFFLAVAEERSLQRAAIRLGVNHSTAFRRINRFEEGVGARLFERLADGYHLTQAGEELAVHARRAGEEIDLLNLKVSGKDYRPSGTIRLTAPDNIAYRYLPPYLVAFAERYPDIEIELLVGAESLDLTRREADVAIRATAAPPPHLVGRRVVDLQWAYFAAERYVERAGRRPAREEDLPAHTLIGADGPLRRLPPFRDLENRLAVAMRCSTLDAMSAMAVAGFGIALLPDDQRKTSLIRLFDAGPAYRTTLWLLTHPELRRTERIRLLMDHLFAALQSDLKPQGMTS